MTRAWLLLGAPLSAVRRALRLQNASAVFGPSSHRRVRIFSDDVDAEALTRRISRARLLAIDERESTRLAVWRAGKCKVELELPRVLRNPRELEGARAAIGRLARAFDVDAPSALKLGTSSVDLAAAIAGVGAEQIRGMEFESLTAKRELDARERQRRVGLRVLTREGVETSLLPDAPPILTRALHSADELLVRLASVDGSSLSPDHEAELRKLAGGELPFPATPSARIEIVARVKALLASLDD